MNKVQVEKIFKPRKKYSKRVRQGILIWVLALVVLFVLFMFTPPFAVTILEMFICFTIFDVVYIFLNLVFYISSAIRVRNLQNDSSFELIKMEFARGNTQELMNGELYVCDRYMVAFPVGHVSIVDLLKLEMLYITKTKKKGIALNFMLYGKTNDEQHFLLASSMKRNAIYEVMKAIKIRNDNVELRP